MSIESREESEEEEFHPEGKMTTITKTSTTAIKKKPVPSLTKNQP